MEHDNLTPVCQAYVLSSAPINGTGLYSALSFIVQWHFYKTSERLLEPVSHT